MALWDDIIGMQAGYMEECVIKSIIRLALASTLALSLSGCYTMRHFVDDPSNEVSMGPVSGEERYHFKEEGRYFYVISGLVPVFSPKVNDLIAKHKRKGAKISNLKVEQQYGPVDIGINIVSSAFLFGLVQSMSITYEGDVVEASGKGEQ